MNQPTKVRPKVYIIEDEEYVVPDEYIIEPSEDPPIPYDENADPEKFWTEDEFDKVLPSSPGFITDLVYFFRGTEVPTLYTIWSALVTVSSLIKREAWIQWPPNKMFTNLYVILVGTAGLVKKSTAIMFLTKLIDKVPKYINDPAIRKTKEIRIIKNKATPEAIVDGMGKGMKNSKLTDDEGKILKDDEGNPIRYQKNSETLIILPEMSVSINKKQYAETMISNLLDLYDPHETWEYTRTTQDKVTLKNLHTNFIAATTPDGFASTIPSEATGDGFISRCIIVFQEMSNREFWKPRVVKNGPTEQDLAKRLAWIAENSYGEYDFTPEAEEYLKKWYHAHKDHLRSDPQIRSIKSRMDIMVIKVSMLLKCQEYSCDRLITLKNVQDAETLIDVTYRDVPGLLGRISNRGGTFQSLIHILKNYISQKGTVKRKNLMQSLKVTATELDPALNHLIETEVISATLEGEHNDRTLKKSNQEYTYLGEDDE